MPNWNLEKLYEQHVIGVPQILPNHLIREYNSKAEVKKAIVSANPNFRAGSDKGGAIRIQPTKKADEDKLREEFLKTLKEINLVVVGSIKAGEEGSPSSKFPSYITHTDSGKEFVITLAGGSFANKGMDYERQLMEILSEYFNDPEAVEKPSFLEKLEDALEVEFVGIDKGVSFSRNVKRPLTTSPSDKGDEISDITLKDSDGNPYYISLKDVGGVTVSNAGAAGMFAIDKEKKSVEFINKEKNDIGKEMMKAGGVDIDLVEQGLTDYLNKNVSSDELSHSVDTTDIANIDKLYGFLGSAFDYGYIYVKRKNAKDLEIADLTHKDDLYKFIGDIESVRVKYPYYKTPHRSRKSVSIMIKTDKGNYSFDIRNAKRGILPDQINLIRLGSAKDIKASKANIKKIDKSKPDLERMLNDNI